MAQFMGQGRLKLRLSNSDGSGVPVQCKIVVSNGFFLAFRPLDLHKTKFNFLDSKKHLFTSSSCTSKSGRHFYVCASLNKVADFSAEGYDSEFFELGRDDLACFRGLVLDISYRPINVVCWKRAICLEFMEKADVLEYYDHTVNSPSGSFYIPAVLRVPNLLQVVKRRKIKSNLSRKNVFYRDNYTCQYCSSRESLTIDHVLPAARGGEWNWENLVTACAKCNSRKGQKTVEEANMKLIKVPKAAKDYNVVAIPLTSTTLRMLRKRKGTPQEWRQYLSS